MLVLQFLLFQLIGSPELSLACGLFAFIGNNPKEFFSWDKFNTLGWANDSRGGDACGRVLGNLCEHGVDNLKTYKEFAMEIKNPTIEVTHNAILGHCRKASSGGKDSIYAQPIVLRKKDVNLKAIKDTQLKKSIKLLKDEDIVFSGIHNGTIENYKELAPKYGIPIEDHNDSKVLLTALFYGNFDILTQYKGTAALAWHNHVTNKTHIFKGASKMWISSIEVQEERPLYCWYIGNNNLYMSSLDDSLLFIGATKTQIIDLKTNVLYIFKDGVRVKDIVIDRNTIYQNTVSTARNINYHRNMYFHKDDVMYPNQGFAERAFPALWNAPIKTKVFPTSSDVFNYIRVFDSSDDPHRLQAEKNSMYNSKVIRRAVYNKGRYWMNSGLMHGIYLLNSMGIIPNALVRDTAVLKPYYFVEGVMLDGYTALGKVMEIHKDFMTELKSDPVNLTVLERQFTEDIVMYSKFPIASITATTGEQDCFSMIYTRVADNYYSGNFQPLFSDRRYEFNKGDLVSIIPAKECVKLATHTTEDMNMCTIYSKRCQSEKQSDSVFCIGHRLLYLENCLNPLSPIQDILFSMFDLKSSPEIVMLLVHFMRDFRPDVKNSCNLCASEKTKMVETCAKCKDIAKEMQIMLNEVNYGVFNEK